MNKDTKNLGADAAEVVNARFAAVSYAASHDAPEIEVGDCVVYSFIEKRRVVEVESDGVVWLELHNPPIFNHCRVQLDRSRPFRIAKVEGRQP